jgi:hypothetical protein
MLDGGASRDKPASLHLLPYATKLINVIDLTYSGIG